MKKEFSVVGIPYGFIFDMEQKISLETELAEGVISVCDENNRTFASFGHPVITENDDMPQEAVVMSFIGDESGHPVGVVTKNTFVGCFGEFTPEYTPPIYAKLKVKHPKHIKEGKATLLIMDKTNALKECDGKLSFTHKGFPLTFSVEDKDFEGVGRGVSGSIILQDGKITGVVCAGDKEKNCRKLYAVTAYEIVALTTNTEDASKGEFSVSFGLSSLKGE